MSHVLTPGSVLFSAMLLGLVQVGLVVWLATQQPWAGLSLRADPGSTTLSIARVAGAGPATGLAAGAPATAIVTPDGRRIVLEPADVIEEPDMLGSVPALRRFYDRQEALAGALAAARDGPLRLEPSGQVIRPAPRRPVSDLPVSFWTQIGVGLAGIWLGAWVASLRLRELSAWMFLLAGWGLALAAHSAALYSTRELALPADVFALASRVNATGTLTFGIGMVTLFLLYPRRVVRGALTALPALLIGGWILLTQLDDWPRHVPQMQTAVSVTMLVLLAVILAQVLMARRDPSARAMLGWFGLSVAVGAGAFVLTVILPIVLDRPPLVEQSTGFLFFLLIYAGLALGIARYRLFDLADWSFRILFYVGGVLLLLALDVALVYGLALDRGPALGLSLALVGLVYLPLRERMAVWLRRDRALSAEDLYARLTAVAHAVTPEEAQARYEGLFREVFAPLSIAPLPDTLSPEVHLADGGEALELPPGAGLPGLRLHWARRGTRLFSSADRRQAALLLTLLHGAIDQHRRHAAAVEGERHRINRDMHDNIGVLLMSALHSSGIDRKDRLIRQTLSDLREIIANPSHQPWQLPRLVADLRAEIGEHLAAADIALDWQDTDLPEVTLRPQTVHTLRAILREGTSNLLRHSGATRARVRLAAEDGTLAIELADNGRGLSGEPGQNGNGLGNLRARVEQCGGRFEVATEPTGTALRARLPLPPCPPDPDRSLAA